MADIFISYAREDETRVKQLVSALEGQGWSVFWDRRIPAGETWRTYIGTALEEARCMLVAWSQYSIGSEWVAEEADEAKKRGILIPLLLDAIQPPRGFREIQAADLTKWRFGEPSQRFDELVADLTRRLGGTHELQPKPSPLRPGGESHDQVDNSIRTDAGVSARKPIIAVVCLAALFATAYISFKAMRFKQEAAISQSSQVQPQRPRGQWLIIVGSFSREDNLAAEQRRSTLARTGFETIKIDTNEYPLLRPNLWAVAIGPFPSQEMATTALAKVKGTIPDAYVKQAR